MLRTTLRCHAVILNGDTSPVGSFIRYWATAEPAVAAVPQGVAR